MLKILTNPKDEEYEDILEWLGEEFEPEAFDLAAVNDELKSYAAESIVPDVRPLPIYDDSELDGLDEWALVDLLRRDGDRAPRNLIDASAARGDAMIQALRQVLGSPQYQASTDEGDWWLTHHAAMIAGLIPTDAAGTLLLEIMHRIEETDDTHMEDWLASYWPALFANKSAIFIKSLRAIAENRVHDVFTRSFAADAAIYLAQREGEDQGEAALDWLAGLVGDERDDVEERTPFCHTLLDFPRERHRPLLEAIESQQRGRIKTFDRGDIKHAFDSGRDEPRWERHANPWQFYKPGEIEARQLRWAKEDASFDEPFAELPFDGTEPYVRPEPKIGRNDPCPCGSGKKYKKCCSGKV